MLLDLEGAGGRTIQDSLARFQAPLPRDNWLKREGVLYGSWPSRCSLSDRPGTKLLRIKDFVKGFGWRPLTPGYFLTLSMSRRVSAMILVQLPPHRDVCLFSGIVQFLSHRHPFYSKLIFSRSHRLCFVQHREHWDRMDVDGSPTAQFQNACTRREQ